MAALKTEVSTREDPKPDDGSSPLARVMREFEQLVLGFETGLLRSLEDVGDGPVPHKVRKEACRLAVSELSAQYMRKHIRRSLHAAEAHGRRVEDLLARDALPADDGVAQITSGYFRLYSTELFDLLGQPTDVRFGTLRFHHHPDHGCVSLEMALHTSFFVADSTETLPFHAFRMPPAPSLQNRGILSRKPEDDGAFPHYDSWLLFTFLGSGCLKVEVPVEMCADVYGGPLVGRENDEVVFWGTFVDDDTAS